MPRRMLLRQTNQVKTVPTDAQVIDPDIQVLLVAAGADICRTTAVRHRPVRHARRPADGDGRSVERGDGRHALAVRHAAVRHHSDLQKLFDAWGIEFDPTKVVGDLTGAWRVRAGQDDRVQAVDYVAWFNIRDGINHNDPATADLQQVTVASSGFIAKAPGANIEFTPLLTATGARRR